MQPINSRCKTIHSLPNQDAGVADVPNICMDCHKDDKAETVQERCKYICECSTKGVFRVRTGITPEDKRKAEKEKFVACFCDLCANPIWEDSEVPAESKGPAWDALKHFEGAEEKEANRLAGPQRARLRTEANEQEVVNMMLGLQRGRPGS